MRDVFRRREWTKELRIKLKAAGTCVDCKKPERPVGERSVLCDTCKAERLRRNVTRTIRLSQQDFAKWLAKKKRAA